MESDLNDLVTKPDNLYKYSILFILWGWINVVRLTIELILARAYVPILLRNILDYTELVLLIAGLIYTVYYLFLKRREKVSDLGLSLRYVWISLFLSLMLVNMIQFNVLERIHFELQHPLFMVFISFAIVVSGGILKNKMLVLGGVIFAMCAFISSYLELRDQLILEGIGWIAGFIIPGHLMYFQNVRTLKNAD